MRGLILAVQFLTRVPMPRLADFRQEEFSRCSVWFPFVGLLLGAVLLGAIALPASPWIAGLLLVLLSLALTGGLHLDGAADLADALGAAHRDPARFYSVLKDPHVGAFGVMAMVALLLARFAAATALAVQGGESLWVVALAPAWARLGSLYWSQTLEPIAGGQEERFAWELSSESIYGWALGLGLLTLIALPFWFLCVALACLWLWREFLRRKVGGMSGDCLGAGIEYCECAMLVAGSL